jgi:phage tail-like protein
MAKRDRPYMQFNFLVNLNNGSDYRNDITAGFQEVSGIGMEVTTAEYRNGNEPHNHVRKMNGLNKASDVTFKRGSMGTLEAYALIDAVRNGTADPNSVITTIRVTLQGEDHKDLLTWTLHGARVVKYTCGPLNAKGTETMIEEMVVQYEELTMELESS